MKKHDEKKQGTTGSVNSRNHVKERKAKPKENDKRSRKHVKKKTKHIADQNKANLL